MGVGKTSVATVLAPQLNWSVWDNDAKLEERYGCSAHDISRDDGIDELHHREIRLFHESLGTNNAVICAPGCVADDPVCLQALRDEPWVVLLTASTAVVAGRVGERPQHRPSLKNSPAGITPASFADRVDHLRQCSSLEVSTDDKNPDQVAASILDSLRVEGSAHGNQRPWSSTR